MVTIALQQGGGIKNKMARPPKKRAQRDTGKPSDTKLPINESQNGQGNRNVNNENKSASERNMQPSEETQMED
jgi:hypothetical protein